MEYRCLPVAFQQGLSLEYMLVVIVWSHVIIADRLYGWSAANNLNAGISGYSYMMTVDIWKNTMNIPRIKPKQSSLPTAMAWCITNRFWFLLTPNIRRSLYLQSKDSRLLEKFWTKKMGGVFVDTIKRVQDLMQARDMNLCVLAKKCGISYSTIQTTARRGGS